MAGSKHESPWKSRYGWGDAQCSTFRMKVEINKEAFSTHTQRKVNFEGFEKFPSRRHLGDIAVRAIKPWGIRLIKF